MSGVFELPQQEVNLNSNKVAVHKNEDTILSALRQDSCPLQQCLWV